MAFDILTVSDGDESGFYGDEESENILLGVIENHDHDVMNEFFDTSEVKKQLMKWIEENDLVNASNDIINDEKTKEIMYYFLGFIILLMMIFLLKKIFSIIFIVCKNRSLRKQVRELKEKKKPE